MSEYVPLISQFFILGVSSGLTLSVLVLGAQSCRSAVRAAS